jgi:hypothetical protein
VGGTLLPLPCCGLSFQMPPCPASASRIPLSFPGLFGLSPHNLCIRSSALPWYFIFTLLKAHITFCLIFIEISMYVSFYILLSKLQ